MNTPETTSAPQDRPAELEACATPSAGGQYVTVPVPSTVETQEELERHEAIIADSLINAFVRAGTSLGAIQDKKLYKGQFDNFDAYVQHRWGWRRAHAYRLIQAAQIVGRLSPIGDTLPLPTSESQLRPLSRLDAEKQRLVWIKAVQDAGGRTPTADIVKAAVVGVVGPRKKPATTVTTDPANWKTAGMPDKRGPVEHQPPEPAPGTSVPPASPSPLLSDPTMTSALPLPAAPGRGSSDGPEATGTLAATAKIEPVVNTNRFAEAGGITAAENLLPPERVEQIVEAVTPRSVDSANYELVPLIRYLVPEIAAVLNRAKQHFPEESGHQLSRANSFANGKIQVVMGWL